MNQKQTYRQSNNLRRKTDCEAWETQIESLAKELCSQSEWEAYQNRRLLLGNQFNKHTKSSSVTVLPTWKKYRQQASRMIALYQQWPLLRYAPLRLVSLLSDAWYS